MKTSGGSGNGCMFKFDLLQNGVVTWTSGWISENSVSGQASGFGTCRLRVTVRDSDGETVTQDYDLME